MPGHNDNLPAAGFASMAGPLPWDAALPGDEIVLMPVATSPAMSDPVASVRHTGVRNWRRHGQRLARNVRWAQPWYGVVRQGTL
jgi:hypothetical protein